MGGGGGMLFCLCPAKHALFFSFPFHSALQRFSQTATTTSVSSSHPSCHVPPRPTLGRCRLLSLAMPSSTDGLCIVDYSIHDVRFPTNRSGDGTDAMNKECD